MFSKKKFNQIYNFLSIKNLKEANELLIKTREEYYLHPDYLFLMAKYLVNEKKFYQAIDCIHASLQHDLDEKFLKNKNFEKSSNLLVDKKLKLFADISKKINNKTLIDLVEKVIISKDCEKFVEEINLLMPGVKRKNL